MGKHLFEYADWKKYSEDIQAGREKLEAEAVADLLEVRDLVDAAIEKKSLSGDDYMEIMNALHKASIANHGRLVGLVDRTYERYKVEDERLAALVAAGEMEREETPGYEADDTPDDDADKC